MASLSISTAWNETIDIVKREGGLLFLIAFGLIALPGVIYQALNPQPLPPEQVEPNAMMLLAIPVVLMAMLGTLTISILALGRENVVGSAISAAARRLLPLLGAVLILALALCVISLPIIYFVVTSWESQRGLAGLAVFSLAILFLVAWVRMLVSTPVAAAEPVGPMAILKRSWTLTRGHFWKLLGFVLLVVVVLVVISMVVAAIGGLVILFIVGPPVPGSLAMFLFLIISALANAAFGVLFTVLTTRIYVQLAGGATTGI